MVVMHFWQKYNKWIYTVLLYSHLGYMMSICLITGEVNLCYSIRMTAARFLQFKVTIFPFWINKYFRGNIFTLCKYLVSLSVFFFPLVLAFIYESCLPQLLLQFSNGDISTLSILTNVNSFIRRSFPYLFNHLFILVLTHGYFILWVINTIII